jgi:hypothetical protein
MTNRSKENRFRHRGSSPRRNAMSQPAPAIAAPTPADKLDDEIREALAICGGDPMKALRITLIANAFLEARIDQLTAEVSSGYARSKSRMPAKQTVRQGGA